MIFSQGNNWQTRMAEDDGNILIRHDVDNTAIAEQAKFLRENTDRGFTHDRQMQCMGYIPFDLWLAKGLHKKPIAEAFQSLESDDDLRPFRVSARNTGHSGRIIIK